MPMRRVVFTPSRKRGEIPDGLSVLEAARKLGVDLDSVCGGREEVAYLLREQFRVIIDEQQVGHVTEG